MLLAVVETRKIFGGTTHLERVFFYLLALVVLVVFFVGLGLRVKKYMAGRPLDAGRFRRARVPLEKPGVSAPIPLTQTGVDIAANRTVSRRNHAVGGAHLLLFWGFLGLLAATIIVGLDYDVYGNLTRIFGGKELSFFKGWFYLAYNAVFDTAGLAAIVGAVLLAVRRIRDSKSSVELDYTRAQKPKSGYSRAAMTAGDHLFIFGLIFILVTGILLQGLRIDGAGFPSFERWTWLGYLVAAGFGALGLHGSTAVTAHFWLWWVHILTALAFVAYLPFSKALHMISAPANLMVRDPGNTRRLPAPPSGHAGYLDFSDFTSKELLGFDACTKCGRCHSVCPARTGGAPLSPRDLILDLRQYADRKRGIPMVLDWEERPDQSGPKNLEGRLAGEVIEPATLWSCTTCMACVEICPVGIEHVPTIVSLRRSLVDAGEMDPTLQAALENIATQGNSFGKSSRMRARWTKGLEVPIPDARKEEVEYLWFLGDFASFDERLQEISRMLARVLTSNGISFGILYEDERNAGNDVRRAGEEGLFEMLVEKNMEAFSKARFQKIFTTDPHSFNTLRNEYPAYGLDKPVMHYSELLASLISEGRVSLSGLGKKVTYHDPCYLGRYNRVFDAPRSVITSAGCDLVEMPRNRTNSFCCGAGGGRIWMDDSVLEERPSHNRIREAAELDVGYFVVACPKDYAMFSDAVKSTGNEGRMKVVDIVELFAEASGELALAGSAPEEAPES